MEKISATQLRNHLFDYLAKVKAGDTVIIEHKHQEVAKLVSLSKMDWRERVNVPLKILVSVEELNAPLTGIWEDYV